MVVSFLRAVFEKYVHCCFVKGSHTPIHQEKGSVAVKTPLKKVLLIDFSKAKMLMEIGNDYHPSYFSASKLGINVGFVIFQV